MVAQSSPMYQHWIGEPDLDGSDNANAAASLCELCLCYIQVTIPDLFDKGV